MNNAAQQAFHRAVTNAQLDDKDGPIGPLEIDDDDILIYPLEDNVPYLDPSSSSEEQIIPQWDRVTEKDDLTIEIVNNNRRCIYIPSFV